MPSYDLVIIGAGIAGMTAALGAVKSGIKNILIVDRESYVGGIINQCIHNGFGKKLLGKEVTGPEYVNFIQEELEELHVDIKLNTNVLNITREKVITCINPEDGVQDVIAGAVIFAMGSKEKYAGNVMIPTNGLTGILTVGEAHREVNLEGYLPGKKTIIVAKNKWGFIVARRLIIEGGTVEAVIIEKSFEEIKNSEIEDIIDGFDIPIIENSRVIEVEGRVRIEKLRVMNLENSSILEKDCDSLVLSVGFVPENVLLKKIQIDINNETLGPKVEKFKTSLDGFFACGNIIYGESAFNMEEKDGTECGIKAAEYIKKYIY